MHQILIIDDDVEFCLLLQEILEKESFSIDLAHDGMSGLDKASGGAPYDVIVLDVMLPELNGFDVLKRLRASSQIPVIMLSARGEEVDRIVGLEMGADDYLPKPCSARELIARIRAIIRRAMPSDTPHSRSETASAESSPGKQVTVEEDIACSGILLQPSSRQVRCVSAEEGSQKSDAQNNENNPDAGLTNTEFNLLHMLMVNAGNVVSKEQLSTAVLGKTLGPYDRSMDMHLSNIRKKLLGCGLDESPIKTIRGVGYLLEN